MEDFLEDIELKLDFLKARHVSSLSLFIAYESLHLPNAHKFPPTEIGGRKDV